MDVDIDIQRMTKPEELFNIVRASRVDNDNNLKKHNVGVYFQKIPEDPISHLSAIPYKKAEDLGYTKIDFLSLDLLDYFDSNDQIRKLIDIEPDWSLLESEENVKKLFQIKRHFDLINQIKPIDIETLADCLALIRPGKYNLLYKYIKNKDEVRKILYIKDSNYTFKRSHAIAYATNIVLQLHLLKAGKI
jgi:DNA polymerase III alpha subunit